MGFFIGINILVVVHDHGKLRCLLNVYVVAAVQALTLICLTVIRFTDNINRAPDIIDSDAAIPFSLQQNSHYYADRHRSTGSACGDLALCRSQKLLKTHHYPSCLLLP